MRPLFEILVVVLVVYAGWHQPFKDHAAALFPNAGIRTSRTPLGNQRGNYLIPPQNFVSPAPRIQSAPRDTSWMWKEGPMDRPYKSHGDLNR